MKDRGQAVDMSKETLEQELEHMLREDLIAACQYWGVEVSGSSSGTSLIRLLADKMRSKQARDRVFSTFDSKEKDLLGMLSLSGGAMSYDRLKPYRKVYSYGQLNQTEKDLRKKGIIVRRVMSRLTEFGREVAEFKTLDFLTPHLVRYFSEKPVPSGEKPKRLKLFVDYRDTLLVDMLLLVSYLAKQEIRMTSSWEFPKRDVDRVKEAMSQPTDERFDLVQRMARKAGAYAILENDRAVPSKMDLLFAGQQDQIARRILLSSLGHTRAIWATPDQPTEYTLNLAVCRLRESKEDEWISVTELRDWIRSELFIENQPLKWIQVDEERVSTALETPILLGLLQGAYKSKTLLFVSLTPIGAAVMANQTLKAEESHETFFVLPNFEITVFTSEMDYHKIYRLMLFTEPIRTDVVTTFKITDKSVFQAIEMGLRERDILGFLEEESSKPVPANVVRSIKDWISQATFATVSQVLLLETESEKDLENLLLIEDFTHSVVKRVGPMAVVLQGDIDKLTEDLRSHKCNVTRADKKKPEPQETQGSAVAEQILLYGEQSLSDAPEACMGCPALQSCNKVVRRKAHTAREKKE